MDNANWFTTRKIAERLYLTTEDQFFESNRSNCWLLKGAAKDVLIDTGLGVCNLRRHLVNRGLVDVQGGNKETAAICMICTHVHFDHSGGAHHFDKAYIHEDDAEGLRHGRQVETLNYVKAEHFSEQPHPNFSARSYKVPPTQCQALRDGDRIDLGDGDELQVIHVPGHTKGSIAIYHETSGSLFTGDFVYDCGDGKYLLDWLPTSCIQDYVHSAKMMLDWISDHQVTAVYPGHFRICNASRVQDLLTDYIEGKDNTCSICGGSCLQATTWGYFMCGCFRCCPC